MPPSLPPFESTSARTPNSTFYSDQDEEEPGFTDFQTFGLGCVFTLLPLIFGVLLYFGYKFCIGICSRFICRTNARLVNWQQMQRPNMTNIWGRCRRTVEPSDFIKTLDKDTSERNKSSHALLNEQAEDIVEPAGVFIVELEPKTITPEPEPEPSLIQQRDGYGGVNTGLSQSDLSCSSHGSCYRDYSYGTQVEYTGEAELRQLVCHIVPSEENDSYLPKNKFCTDENEKSPEHLEMQNTTPEPSTDLPSQSISSEVVS